MDEDLGVELPDKLYFRIGELSELVGVEPHVLRYWEQEFRMRPERSPSGQRMYKRRDIARFLRIKTLLYDKGFTIPGARKAMVQARSGEDPASAVDLERLHLARRQLEDALEHVRALRHATSRAWTPHVASGGASEEREDG